MLQMIFHAGSYISAAFPTFCVHNVEQAIVGHTPVQIGSFYTGMGMNGMHILTNRHHFNQHLLPTL